MADYSAQATSLQAPQAAGAEVIAPVQEKSVDNSILASPALGGLADIWAKGLTANAKAEALARQQAVVGQYVREESTLNDALSTGQMQPSTAAARSRANFNKYAAAHPEYIEDLQKAAGALRGQSEIGNAEDQVTADKKQREADVSQAQQRGYTFTPNMTPAQQDAQIQAVKTSIRAENDFKDMAARNAELRAQGQEGRTIADRNTKDTSIKIINDIAGSNLDAFHATGTALAAGVKDGSITPQQAQAQLGQQFSHIQAALQSAAMVNPELAAPYRTLFNESNTIFQKMFDPKAQTEDLENQLKVVTTKMKLNALQDPKFAAVVTVSSLLGNNPAVELGATAPAIQAIARLGQVAPGQQTGQYTPQVIGNPDVETDTLKVLKGAVNQLQGTSMKNKEGATQEMGNTVNQLLHQTGDLLDRGATPERLRGAADFFASPEYAKVVASGTIDKQAAQAAKKTFQMVYEPAIIKGVQDKFSNYLYQSQDNVRGQGPDPKTVGSAVDVTFTGSGVVFVPKGSPTNPGERESQADAIRQLNTSQKAINQLIHIGAHMEGSTDYGAYWEANKHIFMPQLFSKYQGLDIGTVKNGYRYKGGEANDSKNWEKVNG